MQPARHSTRWESCCSGPLWRGVPRACDICCRAAGGGGACAHSGPAAPALGSAPVLWVCVPGTGQAGVPALQPRPPGVTSLGAGEKWHHVHSSYKQGCASFHVFEGSLYLTLWFIDWYFLPICISSDCGFFLILRSCLYVEG